MNFRDRTLSIVAQALKARSGYGVVESQIFSKSGETNERTGL